MTLVKGPNGFVWDLDPVVASGLLGSPSGDYQRVEGADDPDGDAPALGDMTVKQLRAYADERDIDLGKATKKTDILAAVEAADEEPVNEEPQPTEGDDSDETQQG